MRFTRFLIRAHCEWGKVPRQTSAGQREPGPGSLCCHSGATPAQLTGEHWLCLCTCSLVPTSFFGNKTSQISTTGVSRVAFYSTTNPMTKTNWRQEGLPHYTLGTTPPQRKAGAGTQAAAMEECYSATACSLCSLIYPRTTPSGSGLGRPIYINY